MRIGSLTGNPYYGNVRQKKDESKENQQQTMQQAEQTQTAQPQTKQLTNKEKAENFKNYLLDKYKNFGLQLSTGLTPPKHGVAPSFSVDPRLIEQAANDPQKAKELDEKLYAATMIDSNFFQAMNHPPEVKVSISVHLKADGTSEMMMRREYSSLEAKNKYGNFNANAFLDEQEKLLEKNPTDFDCSKAIREDFLKAYRESKESVREQRNETIMQQAQQGRAEQRKYLQEMQQKKLFDFEV